MDKDTFSVGVIGLGSMGMGAARSCIRAGLRVYGIDVNPQALSTLAEAGAVGVSTQAAEFRNNFV